MEVERSKAEDEADRDFTTPARAKAIEAPPGGQPDVPDPLQRGSHGGATRERGDDASERRHAEADLPDDDRTA